MKKSLAVVVAVSAMLVIAWSVGSVHGQLEQVHAQDKVIYATADKANFVTIAPGVSWAPLWGDNTKGAHGTFTKFAPGVDNGVHTHTNDVWIVVLKGAYLYKDDAGEKRVGAGGFLRVPGGHKHWSGGDKKEGALFYEEASGQFDTIPAK